MGQSTQGIWAPLSHPVVYDVTQRLLGARHGQEAFVRRHVRPKVGDAILDLGCGTASLLEFVPEGTSYIGYDMSEEYVRAARSRFGDRGLFRTGTLQQVDLASLPSFDIVIASGVLHHLSDDEALQFLALAKAALRPEGRLVTVDPCYTDGQNPIARLLISLDRGQNVRRPKEYLSLARKVFSRRVVETVEHRRWIPYTHIFMECTRGEDDRL